MWSLRGFRPLSIAIQFKVSPVVDKLVGLVANRSRVALRRSSPRFGTRRRSISPDAITLDPHAVSNPKTIQACLRHCLIASVIESNANEVKILLPPGISHIACARTAVRNGSRRCIATRVGFDRGNDAVVAFIRTRGSIVILVLVAIVRWGRSCTAGSQGDGA